MSPTTQMEFNMSWLALLAWARPREEEWTQKIFGSNGAFVLSATSIRAFIHSEARTLISFSGFSTTSLERRSSSLNRTIVRLKRSSMRPTRSSNAIANGCRRRFSQLRRSGRAIPYNIVGGFSFYERAEVKDMIAYLKLAMNPRDDIATARVINSPPRGIGKTTIDVLQSKQRELDLSMWETIDIAVANRALGPRATSALGGFLHIIKGLGDRVREGQPLSEVVRGATVDTGYVRSLEEEKTVEAEGRLLNIEELVTAAVEAEEHGESLQDFIDHAALVADTDQYKADARVTLMTMHSAKGLEFPIAFIAGMEEGLFPHSRASASEEDLEEERRLCYVAITRAQQKLYITHAMQRRIFGEEDITEPSRFLNELPLELMQNLSSGPSWLGFSERPDTRQNREAAAAM